VTRTAQTSSCSATSDAAAGARTQDLRIKSPLLYQLSYGGENGIFAYL
jgi:hypothetical protein